MDLTGKLKRVETSSGIYIGKTVVIATGANQRELGLAKEKRIDRSWGCLLCLL